MDKKCRWAVTCERPPPPSADVWFRMQVAGIWLQEYGLSGYPLPSRLLTRWIRCDPREVQDAASGRELCLVQSNGRVFTLYYSTSRFDRSPGEAPLS